MWGARGPNVVILECFNYRWEGGQVGKVRKMGGGEVGKAGKVGGW